MRNIADLTETLNLKNLIVVRHGDYRSFQSNGSLTSLGKDQIQKLARALNDEQENIGRCQIFFSPLKRTEESTRTLLGKGLEVVDSQVLYELQNEYDNLFPKQAEDIHKKILELTTRNPKSVILVGHYSIKDYIQFLLPQERIEPLEEGSAILLNLGRQELSYSSGNDNF